MPRGASSSWTQPDIPPEARRKARRATAVVLLLLIGLLWMHVLRRPLPLPAEEGVEVIALDEVLQGTQPQKRTPPPATTPSSPPPQPEEKPIVQGEEEIPREIAETPEPSTEPSPEPTEPTESTEAPPSPEPTTETPPDTTTVAESPEPEPQPDPNVLFPSLPGRSDNEQAGKSEGSSTQSSSPTDGQSRGDGLSFSLAGRDIVSYPRIRDVSDKEGIVVVEIVVDPDGRVVSARPGIRGSTTTDPYLLKLAKEAALQTRFTAAPGRVTDQVGTLTIHFRLR